MKPEDFADLNAADSYLKGAQEERERILAILKDWDDLSYPAFRKKYGITKAEEYALDRGAYLSLVIERSAE